MSGASKDHSTGTLGDIAETAVQYELVRRGYTVLVPWGTEKYDLVLEDGGTFHRLQVKTGIVKEDEILKFRTYSSTLNSNGHIRSPYTADDIDYFVVYSDDIDRLFCVPIEDAPDYNMSLRLTDPDDMDPGNAGRVNWADDYALDRFF